MDKSNNIERQKYDLIKKGFESISKEIANIKTKTEVILPESIMKIEGKPGHTPTDKELIEIIKPLIPDIRQPEDGHTPTDKELLSLIRPLIPKVKDGETPSDEKLLSLIKPLVENIKQSVKENNEKIVKELIPKKDTADEIVEKIKVIKKPWLPMEAIDGDFSRFFPQHKQIIGISSLKQLTDVDYSGLDQDSKGNYILSGIKKFTDLTDTPSSYSSQALKGVRVNSTATGLEFYTTTDSDEKVKHNASDPTAGYLDDKITKYNFLTSYTETDPVFTAWLGTSPLSGYVPTSRTITINGTTLDLSQDRSWTVSGSQWTTTGSDIYYSTGKVSIGLNTGTGQFNLQSLSTAEGMLSSLVVYNSACHFEWSEAE